VSRDFGLLARVVFPVASATVSRLPCKQIFLPKGHFSGVLGGLDRFPGGTNHGPTGEELQRTTPTGKPKVPLAKATTAGQTESSFAVEPRWTWFCPDTTFGRFDRGRAVRGPVQDRKPLFAVWKRFSRCGLCKGNPLTSFRGRNRFRHQATKRSSKRSSPLGWAGSGKRRVTAGSIEWV